MKQYLIGAAAAIALMTVHYQLTKGKLKKKKRPTKKEQNKGVNGFLFSPPW
jgi:hypothetical protein